MPRRLFPVHYQSRLPGLDRLHLGELRQRSPTPSLAGDQPPALRPAAVRPAAEMVRVRAHVALDDRHPVRLHRRDRRQRYLRAEISRDRSVLLVISAVEDTRRAVFGCGEALSQVLLAATGAGFATCVMSRVVEVGLTRDILADVTGRSLPQVLVRIGAHPDSAALPPLTPRRPLADVLHFAD
ncbi:hypothetical protein FZI93_13680 [Mycobacterium sp. CBMA361]|nr:hypothetical protein [Mycolicibacterium sp. CBMA 361]